MFPRHRRGIVSLLFLLIVAGCADRSRTRTVETTSTSTSTSESPRVSQTHDEAVVRDEAADLQRLAIRVQNAPDSIAEAAALRQLRQYLIDHRLLYRTGIVRAADGVAVAGPAVAGQPVRATIEVTRGEQPVYHFSFVPKDNGNLRLIGTE